jgi:transcriptional regulator with XRE-family HTH domain
MSNDTAKPTDTFGRAVARLRKKAGYSTQKAFSAAIGPGGAMVPRIESGESAGGAATFDRIVDVLGADDQTRGELYRLWRKAKDESEANGSTAFTTIDRKLDRLIELVEQIADKPSRRRHSGDSTPAAMPRPALRNH